MSAAAIAHALPAGAPDLTRTEAEALDALYLSGAIQADMPASETGAHLRGIPRPTFARLEARELVKSRRDPERFRLTWWLTPMGLHAAAQRRRRGYA